MDLLTAIVFLIIGLIVGSVAARLFLTKSAESIGDKARLDFEGERARLAAEAKAQAAKIAELQTQVIEKEKRNEGLNSEIIKLTAERSGFENRLKAETENNLRFAARVDAANERADQLAVQIVQLRSENAGLQVDLQNEIKNSREKLDLLNEAQQKLTDAFAALSRQALDNNNQSFVNQAEQVFQRFQEKAQNDLQQRQEKIAEIVLPVKQSLDNVEAQISELEKERLAAHVAIKEQMNAMATTHQILNETTGNLVSILRNSRSRGQWGEIQLRRAVELAGMTNYCDFCEQFSISDGDGEKRQRPDLIVNLPAARTIVVDAKAPMDAFLRAHDCTDELSRKAAFVEHAGLLRNHVKQLSHKTYWESFSSSPEFVLLFLPNEAIYSVALEHDPGIIEHGVEKNVIIATPSTLIALLKAAAYGWRQEKIAHEAEEIARLGKKLYESLSIMTEHTSNLGDALNKSVKVYNSMIGSLEHNVLSKARRFKDLSVTSENAANIPQLEAITRTSRPIEAAELKS